MKTKKFPKSSLEEMYLHDFLVESWRIEGLHRFDLGDAWEVTKAFLRLPHPTVEDVAKLAVKYAGSYAELRNRAGMNVRVGSHVPMKGGHAVETALNGLLLNIKAIHPHRFHLKYENLHPFMDGNGRTGRTLWAWQMIRDMQSDKMDTHYLGEEVKLKWSRLKLGFLHAYYYQTLDASDGRK